MRYNTNNPAPSNDPRDLNDNTLILDELMNSLNETAKDRFERDRYTVQSFHNIVIDTKAQIEPTVSAAKQAVNSTADAAIEEMQETAATLGDNMNSKSYTEYSEMLADPQSRDAVIGIVDGDPDPNLDGWYRWSEASQRWQRINQQPLVTAEGFSEKTLFSLLDSNRLETWLGVNSVDGGPSEHAERLLRLMFGIFSQGRTGYLAALSDANGLMTDFAIRDTDGQFDDFVIERMAPRIDQRLPYTPKLSAARTGYLYAFTDANDNMTELCVRDTDGKFPDHVIESLAPRIAKEIPEISGGVIFNNDTYLDSGGDLHRITNNMKQWSGWGSSTIDEWGELGAVAASFGATYYNGGNGATELQHNLAQMGARPALLLPVGGSIPASGMVVVECSNVVKNSWFKHTQGTLAGVPGLLSCTGTEWRFTRSADGVAVAVAVETPFIPTQGLAHRGDFWLMNEGKNDINNGRTMEQTFAFHKQAFAWNSAFTRRIIVMTHFGHTGNSDAAHTAKCKQLSDWVRATYGDQVFDLVAYLCSAEIWADTGITPTAADLQNQSDLCLPASLGRDPAHMNAATRTAAANKIKAQLINMRWFEE